jgi:RHS repeat-associated protein
MNINGNWMNFAYMDNPTLYTSAYLVANIQGYTKHYYAGSERIASAIGLGGLSTVNNPIALATYEHKWENKSKALNAVMTRTIEQCLNHRFSCKKTLANLYNLKVATPGTMNRYFYHPDHLGSSSWITDGSGNAIQHLHYLPFGEDWVDQRNSTWNTPYTFSGKEKDVETGYGYFGARYYDSGLSIWLSVDPMSDKYPSMSPYNYCANNPVILVDPDGRSWVSVTVNGRVETYYDRKIKSQFDIYLRYGFTSGIKYLKDGSKVGNGQYTVYNDHKNNKYGVIKDNKGNVVKNDRNIIYGEKFTIFAGVTDQSVNAKTLHQNLMGSSYIGGNNPKDYSGDENYDYIPYESSELPAMRHDLAYNKANAKGASDALTNTSDAVIKADFRLIKEEFEIANNPKEPLSERNRARATAIGFRIILFNKLNDTHPVPSH